MKGAMKQITRYFSLTIQRITLRMFLCIPHYKHKIKRCQRYLFSLYCIRYVMLCIIEYSIKKVQFKINPENMFMNNLLLISLQ